MAIVVKFDPDTEGNRDGDILTIETIKTIMNDSDIEIEERVFLWNHYPSGSKDGGLYAWGRVLSAERAHDRKSVAISIEIEDRRQVPLWLNRDLHSLKKRGDGSPETEIADKVRGYTHSCARHVSDEAAEVMARCFA